MLFLFTCFTIIFNLYSSDNCIAQLITIKKNSQISTYNSLHVISKSFFLKKTVSKIFRYIIHRKHTVKIHKSQYYPNKIVMATIQYHTKDNTDFLHFKKKYKLTLCSSIAYVIDQNSDQTLIDKNSQAVVPIASISKLMTAIIVLDAKMPLWELITVTDEDIDSTKGTSSRLTIGSQLSRADMLHIALMSSENRAAAALSRYYPGGRQAFITAMNQKAYKLGMSDTRFENSTGLSSQNVSSARDLAKLVKTAYQYPLIRLYSTDTNYEVNTGYERLHYSTTNALIKHPDWKIGVQKTGFINEAGECLVMQVIINQRPIVIVLLDSANKYSRIGDAQRVRQWLNFKEYNLLSLNNINHS